MADTPLTPELLQELQDEFNSLKEQLNKGAATSAVKGELNSLNDTILKLKDNTLNARLNFNNFTQDINGSSFDEITTSTNNYANSLENLYDKFVEADEAQDHLMTRSILMAPILDQILPDRSKFNNFITDTGRSTSSLKEMAATGINILRPLVGSLEKSGLDKVGQKLMATLSGSLGKADFARQFENSFLSMATATGDFQKVIQSAGADLSGLDNKADAFAQMFEKVGNRTGTASHEVAQYAKELSSIPGAIDDFNKENNLAIAGLNYTEAAMKVAKGVGQSYGETMQELNVIYDKLGTRGKPALEIISRISAISNLSGLPLSKMREFTISAAEAFRFLGDNSQGAIDIMANLGPALKSSGLGPAAINELIKNVTDGIGQMGTAQKAFLSSQTGGPGGLQGAFSIDLMLKKGDLKGVYDKVQQSLMKQFGGKVVGLEEAARSPGAAAQYQKQLSMVQSGAFGGIAKTPQQAEALLEALSKGKGPEALKAPADALKDTLATGTKLMDRQNVPLLTAANNKLEKISMLNSIIAANSVRMVGGNEGLLSKIKAVNEFIEKSQEKTGKISPLLGKGASGGRSVDEILKEAKEDIKSLLPKGKKEQQKELTEARKTRTPRTPNQFASATFENIERETKTQNAKFPGKHTATHSVQSQSSPTNINLICPECHKKVIIDQAKDATKKAVSNYHQKSQVADTNGPIPFNY